MAFGVGAVPLSSDSRTLSPLPGYHRDGLKAVTVFGTVSFVLTTILFVYLTIKLARWQFSSPRRPMRRKAHERRGGANIHGDDDDDDNDSHQTSDLTLGLDQKNFGRVKFSPVLIRQGDPLTLSSAAESQTQFRREEPRQQHQHQHARTSTTAKTDRHGGRRQQLERKQQQRRRRRRPNQFLILVYNLLLADMHQAAAFMLNARWVADNEILVGTRLCWTQGWFVSNGDLSASLFATAIAVHTYLSVVRGWRPPDWALYLTISGLWVLTYVLSVVGVVATRNGRDQGGFYVRAASWCWINDYYENYRFWLHYFWIFLCLILTSALYILIFFSLQRRHNRRGEEEGEEEDPSSSRSHHRRRISSSVVNGSRTSRSTTSNDQDRAAIMRSDEEEDKNEDDDEEDRCTRGANTTTTTTSETETSTSSSSSSGRHPAFLVYPLIYVVCTAPLALGRVVGMLGGNPTVSYFCAAGSLIASNGWLDVVLFSVTRRSILFHADAGDDDAGLDTFAFMRTPRERRYGNMVFIQGGGGGGGPTATAAAGHAAEGGHHLHHHARGESSSSRGAVAGLGRRGRGQRKNGGWGWERIGERMGGWVVGGGGGPSWTTTTTTTGAGAGARGNSSPAMMMNNNNNNRQRGDSQTSLHTGGGGGGNWGLSSSNTQEQQQGIQMDIVTSVVVEIDKQPSSSSSSSTSSSRRPSDGSSSITTRFESHNRDGGSSHPPPPPPHHHRGITDHRRGSIDEQQQELAPKR